MPCTMLGARSFSIENVLMIAASIAAFIIGASEEAVGIMLFFAVGSICKMPACAKVWSLSTLSQSCPAKSP